MVALGGLHGLTSAAAYSSKTNKWSLVPKLDAPLPFYSYPQKVVMETTNAYVGKQGTKYTFKIRVVLARGATAANAHPG